MSRAARAGRGIDLVEPVTLGGITQWISLRSDDESSPLILFLHGAGERGDDNVRQLHHGAPALLAYTLKKNIPAIIIDPPDGSSTVFSLRRTVKPGSVMDEGVPAPMVKPP